MMRSAYANNVPSAVSLFLPITPENIADRLPEAANALGISPETLAILFQASIKAHDAARESLRQQFFAQDGCNAGNDALLLANLKRNIAVSLQSFAYYLFNYHQQECMANIEAFNSAFESIAKIDDENKLAFQEDFVERCKELSLDQLQALLNKIYFDEKVRQFSNSTELTRIQSINTISQLNAIIVVQGVVQFSDEAKRMVEQQAQAKQNAASIEREVAKLQNNAQNEPTNRNLAPPRRLSTGKAELNDDAPERGGSNPKRKRSSSELLEERNSEPAPKKRFWQTKRFKRIVAGLLLFAGICLLGAGIAFSGGALGLGLLFAGLAAAGVGAVISVYNNRKKPIIPIPPFAGAGYLSMYRYIPRQKRIVAPQPEPQKKFTEDATLPLVADEEPGVEKQIAANHTQGRRNSLK